MAGDFDEEDDFDADDEESDFDASPEEVDVCEAAEDVSLEVEPELSVPEDELELEELLLALLDASRLSLR